MELETEAFLVQKCCQQVEEQLGWGDSEEWSTQDFEALSTRIMEKTHVQLSVVTLKRLWGKIRYDSRPTITTLNALAQFVGFENWRAFKQFQNPSNVNGHSNGHSLDDSLSGDDKTSVAPKAKTKYAIYGTAVLLILTGSSYFYFSQRETSQYAPDQFQFSSKKVVDTGIPNTVIFDYDASAAEPSDSIFIQQTWDKRLSRQVGREQRQHTSIYYMPGFFQAKLRINNQVVKEHALFIKSDGWLTLAEQQPVPVYFNKEDSDKEGYLGLSQAQIEEKNILMQPQTPWVGYYNVGDLADVYTNDFIFEAEVKNDYAEGSATCQHAEVHVLFQGATLVIPLSIPGCVSELKFLDLDGKKADLSAFGVDYSDWVKVRAEVKDTVGRVFINNRKADEFTIKMKPAKFAGMIFRFMGTGSVDEVKISRQNGEVVYEETF
jgi:hypothetical protein